MCIIEEKEFLVCEEIEKICIVNQCVIDMMWIVFECEVCQCEIEWM